MLPPSATATPQSAAIRGPSVRTCPDAMSTTRILSFPTSATTRRARSGVVVMPRGRRKRASDPLPSRNPSTPVPARVDTTPLARSSERMRWLCESATAARPLGSGARPRGTSKRAVIFTPSANPLELDPASVLTAADTQRTLWLPRSVTAMRRSAPRKPTATPQG
eukprot:2543600-Rhodomonas_salina.1